MRPHVELEADLDCSEPKASNNQSGGEPRRAEHEEMERLKWLAEQCEAPFMAFCTPYASSDHHPLKTISPGSNLPDPKNTPLDHIYPLNSAYACTYFRAKTDYLPGISEAFYDRINHCLEIDKTPEKIDDRACLLTDQFPLNSLADHLLVAEVYLSVKKETFNISLLLVAHRLILYLS